MHRLAVSGLMVALLAACAGPSPTEFNGSSVKVRTTSYGPRAAVIPLAQDEADTVCATRGLTAQYESTTKIPASSQEEHFFICV